MKVTGDAPANFIDVVVGSHSFDRNGPIHLPWKHKASHYGAYTYLAAGSVSGKNSASITCTIWKSGHQMAKQTATGPYAVAYCFG